MQHLDLETLARLAEETATREEEAHLEGCAECAEEIRALREQRDALLGLPDLSPPPAAWAALEARLEGEGLLRPAAPRGLRGTGLRIAASLVLFLGGGVAGAAWQGGAAGAAPDPVGTRPASAQQASLRLEEAQAAYLQALTHYAEMTGADESADPVNRLAALEGIVLTTQAALQRAPADPVINGYHLTALGQKEAVLRQIAQSTETDTWF